MFLFLTVYPSLRKFRCKESAHSLWRRTGSESESCALGWSPEALRLEEPGSS